MKTLVRIQKSVVEEGRVKVTVVLSDGSTYSHVTDSTVYTDCIDDVDNNSKQEEAIRLLSAMVKEANNLDSNWEPLGEVDASKQNKFYKLVDPEVKQEATEDAIPTDKVKVFDSGINVREDDENWYVDCKTNMKYIQYAKSDFTLKEAMHGQENSVVKHIARKKLKSISAYPSNFKIFDTQDNSYILSIEASFRGFTRQDWLYDQVISLFDEEGQSKILLELQIHGICFMKEDQGI